MSISFQMHALIRPGGGGGGGGGSGSPWKTTSSIGFHTKMPTEGGGGVRFPMENHKFHRFPYKNAHGKCWASPFLKPWKCLFFLPINQCLLDMPQFAGPITSKRGRRRRTPLLYNLRTSSFSPSPPPPSNPYFRSVATYYDTRTLFVISSCKIPHSLFSLTWLPRLLLSSVGDDDLEKDADY